MPDSFLPQRGNYRDLLAFQKADCIYAATYHFAHRFLERGDRTVDQMVQAARSGKQNIAEGAAAATTSRETEIKLYNVARASLQELLLDYEDYLRNRGMAVWDVQGEKARQARAACMRHNEAAYYREELPQRSAETVANIVITLIHQEDVLLRGLIDRAKRDFLQHGGIREEMTRARLEYRRRQQGGGQGGNESYGRDRRNGSNGNSGH